jgi:hypothetical protein
MSEKISPEELTTEEKIAKVEALYHVRLRKLDVKLEEATRSIQSQPDITQEQKAVAIKGWEDSIEYERRREAEYLEQQIQTIRFQANPPKPWGITLGPGGERDGVDYISVEPCETDTYSERIFKEAGHRDLMHNLRVREEAARRQAEQPAQTTAEAKDKTNNKEFTMARQVLALWLLLENSHAGGSTIDKARFINFLTGKSVQRIRERLSDIYSTRGEDYLKWEEDMKYVRRHFDALKLREIVAKIDAELDPKD